MVRPILVGALKMSTFLELTKFQLAPYVALRITCELLDGDLTANDAWLRP